MTAPFPLDDIGHNEGQARKGYAPAICAEFTFANTTPNLLITYTQGNRVGSGGWLNIGGAPGVFVTVAWTHKTTPSLLTLLPVWASAAVWNVDPTVGAPPPYAPVVSGAGALDLYPTTLKIDKTNWTTTTSPLSTANIKYATFYLKTYGPRLLAFYAIADSFTGSPTCHIEVVPGREG